MISDRAGFLSRVSERANVPQSEAADLVEEVLDDLANVLDPTSWETIQDILPFEVGDGSSGSDRSLSIEQFLVELSGDEPVGAERAASHARAVAGTIREAATEPQLRKLSNQIEDEAILALFEEHRGELTSVPEPSDGDIAQHTTPRMD